MPALATELTVDKVLGINGVIGEQIENFVPRESQLAMSRVIADAIDQGNHEIIEASTGIGKSFAYLVPAFLSDKKVVISTGTRNLQDQLFQKDIPVIRKSIISDRQVALLKGRSNYACRYRISKFRAEKKFQSREIATIFDLLAEWAEFSPTGDISEFSQLPENDSLWFFATSNADNCLGSECPEYNNCCVVNARRKAMDADILVINHHLYFSDQRLRSEGFGEILPEADVIIFDESHQLPEVASHFFGTQLSMRQFEVFCTDLVQAELNEAPESNDLRNQTDDFKKILRDFRICIGQFPEKAEWQRIQNAAPMRQAVDVFKEGIQALLDAIEPMAIRGKELAAAFRRLSGFAEVFDDYLKNSDNTVSWYEWNDRGFRLQISPVDISSAFRDQLDVLGCDSYIFTSATLSSQKSFKYYTDRLGLKGIESRQYDSPFDFQKQSLLYLPTDLPDPSESAYPEQFSELCLKLIQLTKGHCFILFTSYRILRLTAEYLGKRVRYPLLIQGEVQRSELMNQFLKAKNPVLLGTSSFWEGVDVKGDQLRCVIIDKLPFKSPQDPVYKKRLQVIKNNGGNGFVDVQVPEATISLRQGVGRLIRDHQDKGIVVICDNRLNTKSYGKGIIESLPNMPLSHDFADVRSFAKDSFPE
ncbi:MAG: ATP-dependent DNA helicase DinG [Gammaproteobacteria bacterium]|jgi:ATP-dependent DNA helicase DinG